jgi:RNA polymerase primary sigma factor
MRSKSASHQKSKQPLALYLHEISLIPLLNREEESELARCVQVGSQEALQKLVESNLRFVVKIANLYSRFGYSLEDLINEGNLGLMEAAKRFDPSRGVKFISYAIWWIRQAIFTALSNFTYPLKVPAKVSHSLIKMRAFLYSNENAETDAKATLHEIAKELGLSEKQMAITVQAGGQSISLHQPLHPGSEHSLEDMIEQRSVRSAECILVDESVRRSLRGVVNELREKEQKVLRLRFGLDCDKRLTLEEIGQELGVTRERIRQIESQALMKLRSNPNVRAMKSLLYENLEAL